MCPFNHKKGWCANVSELWVTEYTYATSVNIAHMYIARYSGNANIQDTICNMQYIYLLIRS